MLSSARVLPACLAAALCLSSQSALGVDKCKVKQDKKTGVILVAAKGVSGPLTWGPEAGEEDSAFFNDSQCVVGTSAKGCVLADPATVAAATPPATCAIHLSDGSQDCSAWVPGCTPGVRPADLMTPYTQWGASSCTAADATELHAGWVFTNHHSHAGSADPLCLEQASATGAAQSYVGDLLYPVTIAGGAVHEGSIVNDTRLQCARCAAASASCFTRYGNQACPAGTEAQYTGYLYGAHYTHGTPATRLCVDATNYDGTVANSPDGGGWLYPTRVQAAAATDVPTGNGVQCAVCCTR